MHATPGAESAQIDGELLIERLLELPGGPQLLELARTREDVDLVGGAVRDLLLGRIPLELDVVVAEEPHLFARELAASSRLAGRAEVAAAPRLTRHERFGTALVEWEAARVDIAARRAESYPSPGALPEVRSGTVEEDLERRDLTVNAISLALGGRRRGQLRAVEHAFADLDAGRLRVLHERSFLDDLDFTAATRERVSDTVRLAPELPARLQAAACPSELAAAARGAPAEALALAGALSEEQGLHSAAEAASRWLSELRNVRLKITGDDLLDAGLAAGPDIGRRLQAVLEMRLDGTVGDSADAQLEAALRASS